MLLPREDAVQLRRVITHPLVSTAMTPAVSLATGMIRTVAPDGGQRTARRNAWRAMVADRERAAARRNAATAFTLAGVASAQHPPERGHHAPARRSAGR